MNSTQLFSALSNWLAFAATLAVAFFLTPFLVGHLGTDYGIWCVAEAILAYFTLLDMGLAACLVRGVARHRSRDPLALNQMASTVLVLFAAAGMIALVIGTPVMLAFAPRLGNSTAFLLVMLVNLAMTLPLSVFPSVLDGLDRYAAKSAVRLVFLAVRTTAIVLVVQRDAALLPLAIVFTVSNVLEHLTLAVLAKWFLPTLVFRRGLVNRTTFHEIRRYSVDAFLAMLAGRITVQTGTILVGLLLPLGQVVVFVTASRLVEYAKTLLRTITATLTPGVSALEAAGDWSGIRRMFLAATGLVLYLVLPIQLGLYWFGKPFLIRWVPEVGERGSLPLFVLAITLTLSVAQSVAARMLYGLGTLRLFARITLVEAAINVLLLLALIPTLGLVGVAIAVAIPNLLASAVVIAHTLRLLEIPASVYLRVWLRPLAASVVPATIWTLLPAATADWYSIFSTGFCGLIPFAMVAIGQRWLVRAKQRPFVPVLAIGRVPASSSCPSPALPLMEPSR